MFSLRVFLGSLAQPCRPEKKSHRLTRRRGAGQFLRREVGEITPPIFFAVATEFEQIVPTENPGRMHVVEYQPHRIIADWMNFQDLHVLFTGNGSPLARGVTLNLRARAAYP